MIKSCILAFLACVTAAFGGEERSLLARFEVTGGAFTGPSTQRDAVIFYTTARGIEFERLGDPRFQGKGPVPIGGFESKRLLERLSKISFPKIDYQKHFEILAKRPPAPGKGVTALDGAELEVEIRANGAVVLFRMWNPDAFLYSRSDDRAALAVSAAVEAFILSVGKSAIGFY